MRKTVSFLNLERCSSQDSCSERSVFDLHDRDARHYGRGRFWYSWFSIKLESSAAIVAFCFPSSLRIQSTSETLQIIHCLFSLENYNGRFHLDIKITLFHQAEALAYTCTWPSLLRSGITLLQACHTSLPRTRGDTTAHSQGVHNIKPAGSGGLTACTTESLSC